MRILYIDINASFLNPTRSLILPALMEASDVLAFGPGFVPGETLKRGLAAFVDERGPFDIAITNSHILFADIDGTPASPAQFSRFYSFAFPAEDVLHLAGIKAEFQRLQLPRVGLFLESDYYNWSAREIDKIDRELDFVIGFGPEFTPDWHRHVDLGQETFGNKVTDAWPVYASRRQERIASLVHFVSEMEFCFDPLNHRRQTWSVLGINYHARKMALEVLRRAGIPVDVESPLRRGIGLAKKLRLIRSESKRLLNFLNSDFQTRLASSRYSYTCGSALRMPIRKFFEIPAAGAVLVCQPFEGFAAAGFRDRENAICCDPKDILDVHRFLEADPHRAQAIADAGRQLVWQRHSVFARARQLRHVLKAMAGHSFAGAGWAGGEFALKTSP